MKKSLLIYGAGAIGRGFLPWVFSPQVYEYYYVEVDRNLRDRLNALGQFTTFRTREGGYEGMQITIQRCFAPGDEEEVLSHVSAVVTAVGPRNLLALKDILRNVTVPIICCENDASLPSFMVSITGNKNFLFAIPDVITSNSAPPGLTSQDPLGIVTEDGVCYVDERAGHLEAACKYVDEVELRRQWIAKLYIHNTPHCIAAYTGALLGVQYVHEALQNSGIERIVDGAMEEMEQTIVRRFQLDKSFVSWYRTKELARFKNVLLFDPIVRVAREPFRKLASNDRLIGAAQLALSVGVIPTNLLLGIMGAFCYNNEKDSDFNIRYLMTALDPYDFLSIIIRLRPGESLFEMLRERWDENLAILRGLDSNEH